MLKNALFALACLFFISSATTSPGHVVPPDEDRLTLGRVDTHFEKLIWPDFGPLGVALIARCAASNDKSALMDSKLSAKPSFHSDCPHALAIDSSTSVARDYLTYLRESLLVLRKQIPHIIEIAEVSADKFIQTGTLVRAPVQVNFASEIGGRAGGLGASSWLGSKGKPPFDGVTVFAYAPRTVSQDKRMVQYALPTGYRVLFAAPEHVEALGLSANSFPVIINNYTGVRSPFTFHGQQVPSAALLNIVNGWVYTGELTAALTRRGKMPVFYLSFALDARNDYQRAAKYTAKFLPNKPYGPMKSFHDDVIIGESTEAVEGQMVIPPLEAGDMGGRYLDQLDRYLADYTGARFAHLEQILDRAVAVKKGGHSVFLTSIGHTFPAEVPVEERAGVIHVIPQNWRSEAYEGPGPGADDLMIVLGMPTYPTAMAQEAQNRGLNIIILSSEPPPEIEPDHYETERYLWLQTPWPLGDGAIGIPGYDIEVLPVTGFMNGALFYALRSELTVRSGS